jgi:hypothetical protein
VLSALSSSPFATVWSPPPRGRCVFSITKLTYAKQNLGFTHQPAPTHLQHPYEKRPTLSKKMLAERCSTQSSTGREWIPKGAGNGNPWRR